MEKLISTDALEGGKFRSTEDWTPVEFTAWKQGWNDAIDAIISNVSTADAPEVVRCKDCKKYIPYQKLPIGTSKWCDLFDRATCEMNYCGWGERREDETD